MHEKESLAGAFWLVLLIIAGWGGLVRYLIDVKQSKATWSWINALAQIVVSGFTGVIGGLISIESGFSIYMILATAGISGAMGSVALTHFWERLTGVKMQNLNPQRKAFLDMLAWSEGTDNGRQPTRNHGYDVIVGGELFTDYSDHPRKLVTLHPKLKSTAAGRYQLLSRWWDAYRKQLGLKDFSPKVLLRTQWHYRLKSGATDD